jgi:hypothetical protein
VESFGAGKKVYIETSDECQSGWKQGNLDQCQGNKYLASFVANN